MTSPSKAVIAEIQEIWCQPCDYGVIILDDDHRMKAIVEKPVFVLMDDLTMRVVSRDGVVVDEQPHEKWGRLSTHTDFARVIDSRGR